MDLAAISLIIGFLGAPIALVLQHVLGKRKNKVDVTAVVINASQDAVEIMQGVMLELRTQVAENRQKNEELELEILALKRSNDELTRENAQLKYTVNSLREEVNGMKLSGY